jgi:hypothetical protein
MTDAREVLRDHFYGDCSHLPHHRHDDKCVPCETRAGGIIAALAAAGLTPPMPTGRLHKALQDAFQYGAEKGFDSQVVPNPSLWLISRKHEYCDEAMRKLMEAASDE